MNSKRKTKIAFLTYEFPPILGGVSRLSENLYFQLRQYESVEVDLITHAKNKNVKHILPERRVYREWRTLNVLNNGSYDVVISGIVYPEGVIASLSEIKNKVILVHGLELFPHKNFIKKWPSKRLKNRALQEAQLIISNSNYTKQYVEKEYGVSGVYSVPLGVDSDQFKPVSKEVSRHLFNVPLESFVLVTLSRIHHYKGFLTVFKAIKRLVDKGINNLLYLIGGVGPDLDDLKGSVCNLGLQKYVKFVGKVDSHHLNEFYSCGDLFVMCSEENIENQTVEGFGLSFLEAQSCGIPVIGTRSGGIPDAIDEGETGFLINQKDETMLVDYIERMMSYSDLRVEMGVRARALCKQKRTWKIYGKQVFDLMVKEGVLV